MKKAWIFLLILSMAITGWAQNRKWVRVEQEKEPKERKEKYQPHTLLGNGNARHGGYGGLVANYTRLNGEEGLMLGVQGAWVINHGLAVGVAGYGLANGVNLTGIDPDNPEDAFGVEMGYGGLMLEPIVGSRLPIHLTFPVLFGMGYMAYFDGSRNTFDRFDNWGWNQMDEDIFFVIEPGINAELNLLKNVRLGVGVKYRFLEDLDMIHTSGDAYNGWSAGVTLKFGAF